MKHILLCTLAFLCGSTSIAVSQTLLSGPDDGQAGEPSLRDRRSQPASRPNIIVIFTDDHGWADLGAQGVNQDIRTPNVDQLARDGVRFPRGYVTAPQCTPSRAGLISGRYQQKFGLEQNGTPMPAEVVTLPERLKQVGYTTGISGKWHLDVEHGPEGGRSKVSHRHLLPHGQGFDEYFTGFMNDYTASHALDGTPYPDAPRDVTEKGCRVVLQTEWALQFLKRRAAQVENREPFFLYLAYMAPHTPLEFPEPWISQVPKELPRERRSALALLAAIDDGVGRVRQQLADMGQTENTLIFFLGDNGAPLGSSDPAKRKIWDGSLNLPMRGQKGMLSEGGIRVPFLAAWPGKIPAGQVFEHPVISLDIAATAADVAKRETDTPVRSSTEQTRVSAPPELDGVNLLPHLTGEIKTAPHDALYWRWVDQAAIQEFPHKLILPGGDAPPLLFDITDPENETHSRDLSATHPQIVARLRAKLDTWLTTLKPPGPPEPLAPHRAENFVEAEILPGSTAPTKKTAAPPGESFQGWSALNGTLERKDDHLALTPAAATQRGPRLFLSNTQINLQGPVTATLRLRAKTGGPGTLTWRTKTASFTPAQSAAFTWPSTTDFQEIKVELPEAGRLIHLRLTPPRDASALEVQSIELRGKTGPSLLLDLRQPNQAALDELRE